MTNSNFCCYSQESGVWPWPAAGHPAREFFELTTIDEQMNLLSELTPQPLWGYFARILEIPRPSKKEEKIIAFLEQFAGEQGLPFKKDEAGNVLISKPAFPGREGSLPLVLQTHLDMVCEKNSDKVFDFEKDAIVPVMMGEWVSADGTTLGADDGIGIAAQLAVLASGSLRHGPLECLFTVDEETGLTGARALKPGFFSGTALVNLDSEDEGEIFIGCAGGMDTTAQFSYRAMPVAAGKKALRFRVTGLAGGHSGDDIHRGLGNANKLLARFLVQAAERFPYALATFDGGNLRNAIAREAEAVVVTAPAQAAPLRAFFDRFASLLRFEYEITEPGLTLHAGEVDLPAIGIDPRSARRLLDALTACPHGVLEMSSRMPGMVETSTNLAAVKCSEPGVITVTTSQRSEIESRKIMAASMVASLFRLAGATVDHSDGYPGWTPNPSSPLLKSCVETYRELFGTQPVVRSIHAGLECGLFLEKYPGLDMVSIGPTIKGAHSPSERINIETVRKFWDHLVAILELPASGILSGTLQP